MNQKSKNKLGIMGTTLMNNVLYMFLNTFLVAYFFKLSNYDYKIISIYYIFSFIFLNLTFHIFAKLTKQKGRVFIYRLGIIIHMLYILLLAILKDNIINYYIPLGALYGIVQGLFWSSGHILININAGSDSKDFVSLKSILSKTLKVITPIIFGASIEFTSFSHVAFVVVGIAFIQFLFSLLIKEEKTNIPKYNMKKYLQYLKKLKSDDLKTCYEIVALDGVINYLLETIVTILIVMTFKTTLSLGFLTTIFAICSILSLYIFQRKIKNNNFILKFSVIPILISIFLLLIDINKTTVIIYNLITSIFLVLLLNTAEARRYSIASQYDKIQKEFLTEHQVLAEYCLNITRIICYFILFLVSFSSNISYFKVLLVLVGVCIYYYSILLLKVNKKH